VAQLTVRLKDVLNDAQAVDVSNLRAELFPDFTNNAVVGRLSEFNRAAGQLEGCLSGVTLDTLNDEEPFRMAEGAHGLDLHDFSASADLSHLATAGLDAESGSLRSLTDHPSHTLRMACTLRGISAMVRYILYLMITFAPTGRILHKTFAYP